MQEKERKNTKARQENSLVKIASEQPDVYVPITLPFFNKSHDEDNQEDLKLKKNGSLPTNVERQGSSAMKLEKVESLQEENDVSDMLIDKDSKRIKINEMEPILLQLPSTLPLDWLGASNQSSSQGNSLEKMIEQLSLGNER